MASPKQRAAARRNSVRNAQAGTRKKKTLKRLSARTRTARAKDALRAAIARAK